MEKRETIYQYLIVATLAFGFSSNFLFLYESNATDAVSLTIRLVCKVLAMLLPAFYAYYRRMSLRQLLGGLLVFSCLNLVMRLTHLGVDSHLILAVDGIVSGLAITATGSVLFLLPVRKMKSSIILGYALAALLVPLIHLIVHVPDQAVKTLLFSLFLCAFIVVVLVTGAEHGVFSSVVEVVKKYGGVKTLRTVLLTQQTSVTFMLIIATLLAAILGMFESYSAVNGYVLAASDTALFLVFLIVLVMYLVSLVRPSTTWFNTLFSGLMLVCIVGLFAVLMMPDFPTVLSSYFSVMLIVALIPVCVFSIEFAKEQRLSPVFICGTLPALIAFSFDAGYLLNLVLYDNLGANLYDVSKLAAVSLALIAGVVMVLFVVISRKANTPTSDVVGTLPEEQSNGDAATAHYLMEDKGLSQREAEIAIMFAQGRSAPYISQHFYLAESTVKSHLKRVYAKLGVHNKQDLLDYIDACRR